MNPLPKKGGDFFYFREIPIFNSAEKEDIPTRGDALYKRSFLHAIVYTPIQQELGLLHRLSNLCKSTNDRTAVPFLIIFVLMSQTAIRIQGVSKKYTIGKQKDGSLRGTLASLFSKAKSQQTEFMALNDVSFTVNQGEVVGIIGKNGAGKSTLLKVLSQITKPSSGRVELNGRVASLLEVGTGFHPELTGRENVYLNGTILGMTRKEVAAKFDEIVAFSGVEKFIDTPVKHYSSGMYVRLAFAVAAHLEPEILIIDEVLAVGDAEFQKKCLGKMKDVAGEGRTVLFVSHDLAAVKQLCDRGVLLKEGKVVFEGKIEEAINQYTMSNLIHGDYRNDSFSSDEYALKSIKITNELGESNHHFSIYDKVHLNIELNVPPTYEEYSLFVNVKTIQGQKVFAVEKPILGSVHTLIIDSEFLTRGLYTLDVFVHIPRLLRAFAANDICMWEVLDTESELSVHAQYDYGVVFGNYKWI